MPPAVNALDGSLVHFEDGGGAGAPVLLYGGFLDPLEEARESDIARALPSDEFRLVVADHRGLGRSERPHDPGAYAMALRAADAVAVLRAIGARRAHVVGTSWGGRLAFGIAQHAPRRVRALVVGGQQPYEWPDSPLTRVVTEGLEASLREGMEALVARLEEAWGVRFPERRRARYLAHDPAALHAAWTAALADGPVAPDLATWTMPCLIFMGAADADFIDLARRAAGEIPRAELVVLEGADHYGAHTEQGEPLIDAILRTLRSA